MKTLVLGGYGNFGARICRALSGDPSVQLLIGGRDLVGAKALANSVGGDAQAIAIDLSGPEFAKSLHDFDVQLVIHTAGPFQQQAYGVACAAAKAGAHYIDLADGRRFVCDFANAMDASFRLAGRTALSGASTVPALSSAVVDHLCEGWKQVDAIDICIAPAQTAPRGKATLAAVLGYCGTPIQVWAQGTWQSKTGWAKPEQVTFARMRPRKGALCDIPDLELFPPHYSVTQRVMFRAALEVGLAQRGLAMLAVLRSAGLIGQPHRLAGFLNSAAQALDFMGTATGGMVVRVEGINASNRRARRAWHVTAVNDHGPEIPCMAAIQLARKLARGESMPPGAYTCMNRLRLAEFESEFARWGMVTDTIDEVIDHGTSAL